MSTTIPTTTDLDAFVRTAKRHDVPDATIVPLLRQGGWSERRVYRSLGAYYAETIGTTPPVRGGDRAYARDAFYYLLNFFSLGSWVFALGGIFYVLIDRALPDGADRYGGSYGYHTSLVSSMSWQLATVIIAFPIFAFIHASIERDLRRRPEAAESGVRSWLTYLALVITAMTVVGDGICFLGSFLSGSLSTRFVLDSAVVFGLGSAVFAYYLSSLRAGKGSEVVA